MVPIDENIIIIIVILKNITNTCIALKYSCFKVLDIINATKSLKKPTKKPLIIIDIIN